MSDREVAERLRKRRPITEVQTEEGTIHVRGLSGAERKDYLDRFRDKMNGTDVLIADQHLVALALVDASGTAIYETFDDSIAAVCDWAIPIVQLVAKSILDLSGLSKNALEESEKNS